jgi:Dyp-type peroxidase family
MAARAPFLGDVDESSPEHWEKPLGTPDVHVVLAVVAPNREQLGEVLAHADATRRQLAGVEVIWRQECYALPTETEHFGFRDGISHPAVEGSGIPGTNTAETPIKAGEFVLGYPDETGAYPPMPQPEVLGRNGTYAVFRKLHQRVGAFRQYLHTNAPNLSGEELLAAKMMGRWRSGAPLALAPEQDDRNLGGDRTRNNEFLFADDPLGLKTPPGSHIRRANPRDASVAGNPRLHRMIRRGTSYGPPLPEGILEDDGADRGIMFVFIGAHLRRQFEFVQTEWLNDSVFIGGGSEKDPVAGTNEGRGTFVVPRRPVRRRLQGLPGFVVTRGGEYCFMPSLRALRWLADLGS